MKEAGKIYVILDNIRSVHNVGSIFRTAECAGVTEIILCGTTPTPVDRFGRARKDFTKVALGAEIHLPWRYFKKTAEAVNEMKGNKVKIISVEQSSKAIDYRDAKLKGSVAVVFGAEVIGVSPGILKASDEIIEIPMRGMKESLNVSVTVGVILFSRPFFG